MSGNSWNQSITRLFGDGTALTNTTTATSILPGAEKIVLPTNYLFPGIRLRVQAAGRISTAASSPGTITFDLRMGSTVVFNGGASGTLATSATNLTWKLEMDLHCRAYGASTSTTLLGTGILTSAALSSTTPIMLLPTSAPAVGTGVDSTASQQIDLFATWSVANASNTITLHDFELVLPN